MVVHGLNVGDVADEDPLHEAEVLERELIAIVQEPDVLPSNALLYRGRHLHHLCNFCGMLKIVTTKCRADRIPVDD